MFPSSLVRGRRPEAFLKVERGRRSRGGARNVAPGGAETARRALRPVREELAARWPGGNAGPRKRGAASENRRWSAERRASLIAKGRGAARTRPGTCSHHAPGGLANPRAFSALRRPSSGGGKEKQNPGATTRRGNEETTLFDTVNRTTGGHPGARRTAGKRRCA